MDPHQFGLRAPGKAVFVPGRATVPSSLIHSPLISSGQASLSELCQRQIVPAACRHAGFTHAAFLEMHFHYGERNDNSHSIVEHSPEIGARRGRHHGDRRHRGGSTAQERHADSRGVGALRTGATVVAHRPGQRPTKDRPAGRRRGVLRRGQRTHSPRPGAGSQRDRP